MPMTRAELGAQIMQFLETIEQRDGDDFQASIAFFAVEVDDGTTLDYVTGFAGDSRRWVQDAFIDMLPDIIDIAHSTVDDDAV